MMPYVYPPVPDAMTQTQLIVAGALSMVIATVAFFVDAIIHPKKHIHSRRFL